MSDIKLRKLEWHNDGESTKAYIRMFRCHPNRAFYEVSEFSLGETPSWSANLEFGDNFHSRNVGVYESFKKAQNACQTHFNRMMVDNLDVFEPMEVNSEYEYSSEAFILSVIDEKYGYIPEGIFSWVEIFLKAKGLDFGFGFVYSYNSVVVESSELNTVYGSLQNEGLIASVNWSSGRDYRLFNRDAVIGHSLTDDERGLISYIISCCQSQSIKRLRLMTLMAYLLMIAKTERSKQNPDTSLRLVADRSIKAVISAVQAVSNAFSESEIADAYAEYQTLFSE